MDNHAVDMANADKLSKFVSDEIRAELARTKRTQGALAVVLNLNEQTVSRRLNGFTPFSSVELLLAASWFDLSVSELFARAEARAASLKKVAA